LIKTDKDIVMVTGATGNLGKELVPLLQAKGYFVVKPSHKDMPVEDIIAVSDTVMYYCPKIIFHCAAFTDVPGAELTKNRRKALDINVTGSENIKAAADKIGAKVIYISTDYVYEGVGGGYKVKGPVQPRTFYGFTKLAGECCMARTDLVIRTSFLPRGTWGKGRRQLQSVFSEVYTSKDWVDVIATLIVKHMKKKGILNIGTEKKTLKSLAIEDFSNVGIIDPSDLDLGYEYPTDCSMVLSI
tara:strand:- start:206 stop:934 length:729 start_codon:yes stop_codon:yes gene_type:complete